MGRLIVIEGIDGGGKTTLAKSLVDTLRSDGVDALFTREPTDGPHGRRLREAAQHGERFEPDEELALFFADRRQHVAEVVGPALQAGRTVVQDRSFYSTAAYQGLRGLDRDAILRDSRSFAPEPDVLLVVDLPVEVALERAHGRGQGTDAFEQKAALGAIRSYFASIEGAVLLDGTRSPAQVLADALEAAAQGC